MEPSGPHLAVAMNTGAKQQLSFKKLQELSIWDPVSQKQKRYLIFV